MQAACFLQNPVDGGLDGLFFGDIGLDCEDLAWILFRHGGEFITCFANVDGVDFRGAVGEAAVCYAEPDA